MKTYRVQTHELIWYTCFYDVDAESEEEAKTLVEDGYAYMIDQDFDEVTEIEIEKITEIDED